MSRVSFRPRPVDVSKQLSIVRDVNELDNADGLLGGTQLPGDELLKAAEPAKKKVKEIPVPDISTIPTYTREYLPLFHIPGTYLRGKGGTGWEVEGYVEYDLEGDDEDWLENFNRGTARLTDDKLEKLLWKLEVANAEANDRVLTAANASASEKVTPLSAGIITNMPKEEAIAHLRKTIGGREAILREVYEYWAAKRLRTGRPMLRRLIAPTSASDANPLTVFRPREKVHRPQTRRRKENSLDCLEKMKQLRDNILAALEMTEMVVFRESRKRDIHQLDCESVRYQLSLAFTSRDQHEAVEASTAKRIKEIMTQSAAGASRLKTYLDNPGSNGSSSYDSPLRRALQRKKRRLELEGSLNAEAVAKLPAPPHAPNHALIFALQPRLDALLSIAATTAPPPPTLPPHAHASGSNGSAHQHPAAAPTPPSRSASSARLSKAQQQKLGPEAASGSNTQEAGGASTSAAPPPAPASNPAHLWGLPSGLDSHQFRARVGRGGRMMLTRCDPLTRHPHPPALPPPQPEPAFKHLPSTNSSLVAFLSSRTPLSKPSANGSLVSSNGGSSTQPGAETLPTLPWAAQPHLMDLIPDLALDKLALQGQQQARIAATLQQLQHHPHPPRSAPLSPPREYTKSSFTGTAMPPIPPLGTAHTNSAAPQLLPPHMTSAPAVALPVQSPAITSGSQATAAVPRVHSSSHLPLNNTALLQHQQQQMLYPASSAAVNTAVPALAASTQSQPHQPTPQVTPSIAAAAAAAASRQEVGINSIPPLAPQAPIPPVPPPPLNPAPLSAAAARKGIPPKLPLPTLPAAIAVPSRSPSPSAPALRGAVGAPAPVHPSTRGAPNPAASANGTASSGHPSNTGDGASNGSGTAHATNTSPSPAGTPGPSTSHKRGASALQAAGRATPSSSNKRGPGRPKGSRGVSATEEDDEVI